MLLSSGPGQNILDVLSELVPEIWPHNSILQETETTACANQHVHARIFIVAV